MKFAPLCFAAAALGLAASLVPSGARADFPPYTKVVTIAVLGPMSGSQRQYGIDLSNGVQLAIDERNQARGLTDFGWKIQTFDDQADPGIAMQEATFALVDPTTSFVIGHVGEEETNFALQTYHDQEVPVIVPTQPYFGLTQHGYDDVFRLCPTDVDEGAAAARYAEKTLKSAKAAIVYVQDQDGVDSGQGFQNYASSGTALKAQSFAVAVDQKSDKDIVSGVTAYGPDVIFLAGAGHYLTKTLSDLRAAGVTAPVIANGGFFDADVLKKAGSAAEGMVVTSCVPPLDLMPSAQLFVHHYEAQYGQVSAFALYGYVAAQLAIAAATQGRTADRRILDRLISVGTFPTVIGQISFAKNGDQFTPNIYFYAVAGGSLKYAASSFPNPLVISK